MLPAKLYPRIHWNSQAYARGKLGPSLSAVVSADWFHEQLKKEAHRFSKSISKPYSETP